MANFDYDVDQPDGPYNDPGAPATDQESAAEFARNVGAESPEQEWILSPFDSWERNPFYAGPRGRHPEDDRYDDEADAIAAGFSTVPTNARYQAKVPDDEIPF